MDRRKIKTIEKETIKVKYFDNEIDKLGDI